jgi:hypothetical protein
MASPATVNGDINFLGSGTYTGEDLRSVLSDNVAIGAVDRGSFKVLSSAGLTLTISPGTAYVRQPGDGTAYVVSQFNTPLQITLDTPAPSGNPRVDSLYLQIADGSASGDTSNQFTGQVIPLTGAQAASATLDNRNGALDPRTNLAASPAYIPLADIIVNAGATSVSNANIRDRRPVSLGVPTPTTDVDQANMAFSPAIPFGRHTIVGADYAQNQVAVLTTLNRRIPATKLRWCYWEDPTTPISSGVGWRFVICGGDGYKIADTGIVLFTGTAGTAPHIVQNLTLPYAGYVFEPGQYYTWFGLGGATSGMTAYWVGTSLGFTGGSNDQTVRGSTVPATNHAFAANTGGTAFPTSGNILGMADLAVSGISNPVLPCPVYTLST